MGKKRRKKKKKAARGKQASPEQMEEQAKEALAGHAKSRDLLAESCCAAGREDLAGVLPRAEYLWRAGRIYQGEAPLASDNIFIGNFMVEGLSRIPEGNEIVINLNLDLNGVLEVTAGERRTGLSKTVRMETEGVETGFDLAEARRNIAASDSDKVIKSPFFMGGV